MYTWGIIISVFLIGSSVGYMFGGKLADRKNHPRTMLLLYVSSIFSIAIIPLVKTNLFPFIDSLPTVPGTTLGVILLYFTPNLLLSIIVTVLMKDGLAEVVSGKVIGSLHSASAIGSVLGTLVTTFWFIPWTNINFVIGLLAALVYITLIFYGETGTKGQAAFMIIAALFLAIPFISFGGSEQGMLLKKTSLYHDIYVYETDFYQGEEGKYRSLTFGNKTTIQGMMNMYMPDNLLLGYSQSVWEVSNRFAPESQDIFIIGHGIGTLTRKFEEANKNVLVAEIDKEVLEVSKDYFQYDGNSVVIGDGRQVLKEQEEGFDVIFLDAYNNTTQIPFHLISKEFFTITNDKLKEDGILIINAIGNPQGNILIESLDTTLKSVFPHVYVLGVEGNRDVQNLTIIGSRKPLSVESAKGHRLFKVEKGKIVLDGDTKLTNLN